MKRKIAVGVLALGLLVLAAAGAGFGATAEAEISVRSVEVTGKPAPGETVAVHMLLDDDDLRAREISATFTSGDGLDTRELRFSRTRSAGEWVTQLRLPTGAVPGSWFIRNVTVVDDQGTTSALPGQLPMEVLELAPVTTTRVEVPKGAFRETQILPVKLTDPDRNYISAVTVLKGPRGQVVRQATKLAQSPSGEVQIPVRLTRGLGAGAWNLGRITLYTADGTAQHLVGGRDYSGAISVTKGRDDAAPPEVRQVQTEPERVVLGQPVQVSAQISDDLAGVAVVTARLVDGAGYARQEITLAADPAGRWSGLFTLPQYAPEGKWTIEVTAEDRVGRSTIVTHPLTVAAGREAPAASNVASARLSATPESLSVEVELIGEVPTRSVTAVIQAPGMQGSMAVSLDRQGTGRWQRSVPLSRYAQEGAWRVSEVHVTDELARQSRFTGSELPAAGLTAVVQSEEPDMVPPALEVLDVSPAVTAGGRIRITATVRDDLAGVADVGVLLASPDGQNRLVQLQFVPARGTWEGTVKVPDNTRDGVWVVQKVIMTDDVGNAADVTDWESRPAVQVHAK